MSIEIVKSQIQEFLSNDKPEVLAIKGAWGVGKTYSWNKFLLNAKSSNSIALERYSYVSLFGINSLDAFKYTIFEHVIKREMIGTEANIETFKNNTTGLLEVLGRKSLGWFKGASLLKSFTPAIESISFLSLNNSLICIDDLERRGSSLFMKDALGLVSQLKEQKRCKIVLLLNDKEEGLEDYTKYREKVVDVELRFEPTSFESAEIAFNTDTESGKKLSELTQKLDIKNIRVLKKIERLINIVLPLAADYEPEIEHQVRHSLTLFSWCYYCANDGAPPLEFVTNLGYDVWELCEEKEEDEEKKLWKNLVSSYEYQHTDELDLVLAEAVKTGYIEEEKFKKEASKKNEQIRASKSEGSFSETWRLYHDSFDDNEEELITKLYESFKKNVRNVTPTNLNGTVRLFREVGEEGKASEIIDFYIQQRKAEKELFNMRENNFFGDIRDEEIINKFNGEYQASVTVESAADVLKRIAGKNGWNQEDEVVLANTSIDDYYQLFKNEKGEHLSSYIYTCLKFGQFSNASDQQKEIANRVTEALKKIAAESELNKRRVKKFGVEIDA
jgi:hypothetical protein